MEKFRKEFIGRKVKFIDAESHEEYPEYYPPVGSIGTIVFVADHWWGKEWAVQWAEDSGVDKWGYDEKEETPYTWFCCEDSIELVEEEEEKPMTNEEVWKMLEPKMTKNGFTEYRLWGEDVYAPEDVHDMVALAYRVGFMRNKKGKPFKYERKVNGND